MSTAQNNVYKLGSVRSLREFGCVGQNATLDTAGWQAALAWADANSGTILVGPGKWYINEPLVFGRSTKIIGPVKGNTHGIYLFNGGRLDFDGAQVTGGFCFNIDLHDMNINCEGITDSQDYAVLINQAYRVNFWNVRVVGVDQSETISPADPNFVAAGIKFTGIINASTFMNVAVLGNGDDNPSGAGFLLEHTQGLVTFINADAADWQIGMHSNETGSFDVFGFHGERNSNNVRFTAATSQPTHTRAVNFIGGTMDLPSATAVGFNFVGNHQYGEIYNINGTRITSNNHATKTKGFGHTGQWNNDTKISLHGIDWSYIDPPNALLSSASVITPVDPFGGNTISVMRKQFVLEDVGLSGVDLFTISGIYDIDPHASVFVKTKTWATYNGYGLAYEEANFVIADRASTSYNVVKELTDSGGGITPWETGSVNFTLTSLEVTAAATATDATFTLTAVHDAYVDLPTVGLIYVDVEILGPCEYTPA